MEDFTYGGDPRESRRAVVRFLVGDTVDKNNDSLRDGEVDYLLLEQGIDEPHDPPESGEWGALYRAAAEAADALAARYAREATWSSGGMSVEANQKAREMRATAKRLRSKGMTAAVALVAWAADAPREVKEPAFRRGMMTNRELDTF